MLKNNIKDVERHRIFFAFFICSSFIFLIGFIKEPSINKYYHDSGYYYRLSQSFVIDNNFNITNFEKGIRGYLFPFILFIYTSIGNIFKLDHSISILAGNSIFISFLLIYIIPSFFNYNKKKNNLIKVFSPVVLFMIYWQDLVYYPLSDIYSYGSIIIAMYLLKKNQKNKSTIACFLKGILVGILLYAAYNIRTIYLFTIPIVLLVYLIFHRKQKVKISISFLCIIVLGMIICAIPQSQINKKYYNNLSVMVNTDSFTEGSLFEFQLLTGLYLQRYETYVGDLNGYPQPGMRFIDHAGNQILEKEQIVNSNFSLLKYIEIAVKYPLDFMGIMARHLINILHLPYNHIYIKNINYYKSFFTVLNYIIIYVAGIGLLNLIYVKRNRIILNEELAYLLITLIPCIAILPGAIEMRFFIPFYCLIYYFIAYTMPFYEIVTFIKANIVKVIISYIFILALLAAVWGSTFSATAELVQLLR